MQLKKPRCSAKKKAGHSRLVLTDPIRQTGSLSRSNSKLHAAQVRLVFASTQGIFLGVVMVHRGQTISTLSSPNKLIGIDPIPRSPLSVGGVAIQSVVAERDDVSRGGLHPRAVAANSRCRHIDIRASRIGLNAILQIGGDVGPRTAQEAAVIAYVFFVPMLVCHCACSCGKRRNSDSAAAKLLRD